MVISRKRLALAFAGIVAFVVIALHWGANEYASVQFAGFLVATVACVPSLLRQRMRVALLVVVSAGVVAICAFAADHGPQLFLKGLRTTLVLSVLLAVRYARTNQARLDWAQVAANGLYVATSFSAVVACLQLLDSLFWGRGDFDVPIEWFALDYGTVLTALRQELIGSSYFIRPASTFSEPSALAVLALVTMVVAHRRGDSVMHGVAVFTALASCSLLGIAFTGIWLTWLMFRRDSGATHRVVVVFSGLLTGAVFLGSGAFSARLLALTTGSDLSTRIRLVEPVRVLVSALKDGRYLGVNDSYARQLMSSDVTTVFSNWALNQFMYYGLLAPVMIALPFFAFGRRFGFILAILMVANGDAFYYDRFCLLALAMVALSRMPGVDRRFGIT